MRNNIDISLSIEDVGPLIGFPASVIDRCCRCGIHPPWHWLPSMKEPRFSVATIPEWFRIRNEIDLDSLPQNPPPLRRPTEIFQVESEPTEAELETARAMMGLPVDYGKAS